MVVCVFYYLNRQANCSTMQKSNMLTNSDRTIINTFQHIKTSDDIALDDSTNFWHTYFR